MKLSAGSNNAMKKVKPRKKQFGGLGGFSFPPALMGLFEEGAPTFDQVMSLAPQLDAAAGTDVFSRAFAADDPSIITGEVWGQGAMAQATQENPLRTQQEIEEEVKKRTFLGIGKKKARRKLEEENAQRAMNNQVQGVSNLISNTQNFANANQIFDMLGNWFGQQGGNPFTEGFYPKAGPTDETGVIYPEVTALAETARRQVMELDDTKEGRRKAVAYLAELGFKTEGDTPEDVIKNFNAQAGVNISPSKGPSSALTDDFKRWLADERAAMLYAGNGIDRAALKRMQAGGVAQLGYADNSPYKNMPSIDIPGNNITMQNTGMPLLAVPDAGAPRVMPPYSGTHMFPGATSVKEIPMKMKKGGRKKHRVPMYQMGSAPEATPPMAVQLEEGEVFSTPQLDIIDTNAREKHKDMKSDVITDVLSPENYVFSADPKVKITRKRAEDISFGLGPVEYEEGEIGELPKEITAADIMDDNVREMIVADYVKAVRRKYPTSEREDVFSKKTNAANKTSRIPYLAAATLVNEEKRTKGKEPMTGFVSNYEDQYEKAYTATSGQEVEEGEYAVFGQMPGPKVTPSTVAPAEPVSMGGGGQGGQGGGGGLDLFGIGQLANLAGQIFGVFQSSANGRTARKALQADIPRINEVASTQGLHSDLSYGAQRAGLTGQDPTVSAPQFDSTQLDARRRNVSPSLFQIAAGRAMAGNRPFLDAAFENSGDFATAVNAYSSVQAPALGMLADLGMREVETNLGLENTYRDMKQNLGERQEIADVTAENATRSNANQLTGALGQTMGKAISSRGRIAADRLNALRTNALQQAQAKIDANAAVTGAVQNVGATATGVGYMLDNMGNPTTPVQGQGVNNNVDFSSTGIPAYGGPQMPTAPGGPSGLVGSTPEGYWPAFVNGQWIYVKL